jgi:hypothetical protein
MRHSKNQQVWHSTNKTWTRVTARARAIITCWAHDAAIRNRQTDLTWWNAADVHTDTRLALRPSRLVCRPETSGLASGLARRACTRAAAMLTCHNLNPIPGGSLIGFAQARLGPPIAHVKLRSREQNLMRKIHASPGRLHVSREGPGFPSPPRAY